MRVQRPGAHHYHRLTTVFHGATSTLVTPDALRRIRRRRAFTQARLASELGVSRHTVLRWETGEVGIPTIAAKLLNRLDKEARAKTRKR